MDPHRLVEAEKAQAAGHSPVQEPQEVAKEHKVDKLVGFRQSSSGKREYKVRWEGYGPTDDTWEPVAHLSGVLDLVERYDAALKDAPRRDVRRCDTSAWQHAKVRLGTLLFRLKQKVPRLTLVSVCCVELIFVLRCKQFFLYF